MRILRCLIADPLLHIFLIASLIGASLVTVTVDRVGDRNLATYTPQEAALRARIIAQFEAAQRGADRPSDRDRSPVIQPAG